MAGQLTLALDGREPEPTGAETPELLFCPFCGGEPRLWRGPDSAWRVHCTRCAAYLTRLFLTAEEAARFWNMRANGPIVEEDE